MPPTNSSGFFQADWRKFHARSAPGQARGVHGRTGGQEEAAAVPGEGREEGKRRMGQIPG